MKLLTRPLSIALLIVALLGATGFVAGCARYGGPSGLWQRVQAEVAAPPSACAARADAAAGGARTNG